MEWTPNVIGTLPIRAQLLAYEGFYSNTVTIQVTEDGNGGNGNGEVPSDLMKIAAILAITLGAGFISMKI
jgi:hypothetical protein